MSNPAGRSAIDFRTAYRRIQAEYSKRYEGAISEVRGALADPKRRTPDLEEALEAHSRTYLIDGMLGALRWAIIPTTPNDIANLIPEAQVDSVLGTRRYLDYFGYERQANQPLLIVEAKRPSKFPFPPGGSMEIASTTMSQWLKKPEDAPGVWKEWILSLRDYVISVHHRTGKFPVRAVITDGDWLVVFEDPQDAFGISGAREPRFIHVFTDAGDIDAQYDLVFRLLDQRLVARFSGEVAPGAISGLISPDRVVHLLHGLRLRYATSETVGRLIPTITVIPTILLRSDAGSWIIVARQTEDAMHIVPYEYADLANHLQKVRAAAESLLQRVQDHLGRKLSPVALEQHFADDAFESMPAVEEIQRQKDHFRIVTGDSTHYLLSEPTVPDCLYHDFGKSVESQCQARDAPIIHRIIANPRAYFINTQAHHCCHEDVDSGKHVTISEDNRARCGVRSGRLGDVFCEIAPFDEFLCCRTCCFQHVCTKSEILRLPCALPASKP